MNKHVYIDLLGTSLRKYAGNPCLHIKRNGSYTSWTYAEFNRDANRLCSRLKKDGLKKGANAIVIGENTPEWIIAYHAIILTGACTVPVDPNIPATEIESILTTTEASVIFCSKVYLALFRMLQSKCSFLKRIILLETEPEDAFPCFASYCGNEPSPPDAFSGSFAPEDPMVIIFTSGTTGKPKGVVLTQKNFTAACLYGVSRMQVNSNDTVCAVLPLHHVFGCAASMVAALYCGMDIICVPVIKGPLILEALNDKSITYLPAVPKLLQLFYDSILHKVRKKGVVVQSMFTVLQGVSSLIGDLLGNGFKRKLFGSVHEGFGGKLRLIISGGASLNKTYWKGFRRMGFAIVEGYGLTETFGPITVCPGTTPRLGSVGPVLPENEIRIVDPDQAGIGEVLLRGICVFSGYYNNDALTREVIDDDGWFHSGDLGRLDKNGYLYLSGRKKDIIVLDSGKNVYPDELEEYYGASPLIEEIGVFGAEQHGKEIAAAIIVPDPSQRKGKTLQQSTDQIGDELLRLGKGQPVYRRINDFTVSYVSLPRTTTRKLKKNELRKLYLAAKRKPGTQVRSETELSVIEMALMESSEFRFVLEAVKRLAPEINAGQLTPRSHLEIDCGLDSLDRLDLLSSIEKELSIIIPEKIFDKMESAGEVATYLKDTKESGNRSQRAG